MEIHQIGLLLLASLAFHGCGSEQSAQDQITNQQDPVTRTPSNILLIVADDLGYTDLGAFGGEISTPNLDALARHGTRLTNFHTAPSCAPTRAMLLTGMDNHQAGMGSQSGLETPLQAQHPAYQNKLNPDVPTIAETLKSLGYRTLASAKWHLGSEAKYLPGARGFDRSFVLLQGGGGHFDDAPLLERYDKAHWLEDDQPYTLPDDFYSSEFMADKLLEYLDEAGTQQPFFAYLGFTAPHWPLQAPAEDIENYAGQYDSGWDVLREQRMSQALKEGVVPEHAEPVDFEAGMVPWESLSEDERKFARRKMEVYAAMVEGLDRNVGRVIERLETRGDLDNTLIVFISDNGAEAHTMELYPQSVDWVARVFDNSFESIGTARSYVTIGPSWARATAVPFRASKSKISEGGVRVPAFVRLPVRDAVAKPFDSAFMRVMDLAPTFVEVAGGPVSPDMEGRSLWSRWLGGSSPYSETEYVAAETYGRRSVRRGDWKALLQGAPYGTNDWQLYNLRQDLGEQRDLSQQHPEVLAELVQAWQAYADRVGVVLPETPIRY